MATEENRVAPERPRTLLLRDIVDGQLRSREGRRIGRVADVEVEWSAARVRVCSLVLGPEAHLGRVWSRLGELAARVLHGRYEHRIAATEIEEIGPNVMLKQSSDAYEIGGADGWIKSHIFRFIPGSGK